MSVPCMVLHIKPYIIPFTFLSNSLDLLVYKYISKTKIALEALKGQKCYFWPFGASEAILVLLM
jgi:hypothetical protein